MATLKVSAMLVSLSVCLNLAACVEIPNLRPSAASPTAISQGNPSPVAGSSTSQQVNQAAEIAAYKPIEYANASRKGPTIVVLPGGIKSVNATFNQRFLPNTIADFGELELSRANFTVLERSDLGPLMKEFELAYNLGDPDVARRMLQKGKLKATRWIVRFDVLKAEPVASANKSFDASAIGDIAGTLMGGKAGSVASIAGNSIRTDDASGMWLVGMRYKVLDANTTEQVATGYMEDKMEVGAKATSVLGVSNAATGQLTLDTLVQRLVQKTVAEIDAKHK